MAMMKVKPTTQSLQRNGSLSMMVNMIQMMTAGMNDCAHGRGRLNLRRLRCKIAPLTKEFS
eukprot:scaffold35890_cov300-Skeletonema_dohrnii-CCMP3373.AAC.1